MKPRDTHLNTQRSKSVLASALRRQIPWLSFGAKFNPFDRYNPLRPLYQWYNSRQMNNYIHSDIHSEFEHRFRRIEGVKIDSQPARGSSIVDLAMNTGREQPNGMDSSFKTFIAAQLVRLSAICTTNFLAIHPLSNEYAQSTIIK